MIEEKSDTLLITGYDYTLEVYKDTGYVILNGVEVYLTVEEIQSLRDYLNR